MKPILKKGTMKAKGSVLFTVVAVMMVMVVFLMSTLILTTSANRRSFYTYFQTQAQYAAQAGLDAVTNAAYSDLKFSEFVQAQTIGMAPAEVSLDYGSSTMPLTNFEDGTAPVRCFIEAVDPVYIWDDDSQRIYERAAWKITVTASVGTGRNAAQYSTCNYIYANVNDDGEDDEARNLADWNNVNGVHEELTKEGETKKKKKHFNGSDGVTKNAVLTYTKLSADGGGNNCMCLGPQTANIDTLPAGRLNYSGYDNSSRNDNAGVGNVLLVGGMNIVTHQTYVFQKPGEGLTVYGNLGNTNELYVYNECQPAAEYYKDIPYVFVDGSIIKAQPAMTFGNSPNNGMKEKPVNVFCRALQVSTDGFYVNGDLFILDPDMESTYVPQNGSRLQRFTYNNIKKANYGTDGYQAGDLICNNKKLTLGKVEIDGDLIMTNPKGELVVNGNLNVKGTILCAGKISGSGTIKADGGIYVDPSLETGLDSNINDFGAFCDDSEGFLVEKIAGNQTIKNTSTSATIESLNLTQTGSSYSDLVSKLLNSVTVGYDDDREGGRKYLTAPEMGDIDFDFRLYPFCYRPDEIFEQYVRWDLRCSSEAEAQAYITGASPDKLILESRAAGHTWGPVMKEYNGGTAWFPATTPVNPDSDIIIPELKTVDSSKVVDSEHYYNDLDAFNSAFSITTSASKSANKVSSVMFHSYDKDGERVDEPITSDVYVIDENCTVNLADFQTDNKTVTIFINPYKFKTVGGELVLEEKTLGVSFTGSISNTQLRIVINNNTFYYDTNAADKIDYSKPTDMCNGVSTFDYAGRDNVALFFESGLNIKGGDSYIGTTGGYEMLVKTHKIDVISNPIYPDNAAWSGLDKSLKWKYELVPNVVIYGGVGKVEFEKIPRMNAAVIMPDTTLRTNASTSHKPDSLSYREDNGCVPYNAGAREKKETDMYDLNCVGSITVNNFEAQNLPTCVYIGDLNRPDEDEETEEKDPDEWTPIDEEVEGDANINSRTHKKGDKFSNEHQDAG